MKKIVISVLTLALMLLSLAGCGKSKEVKNTQELIKGIGEVGVDSAVRIEAAEKLYNSLGEEDKGRVRNIKVLEKAREDYDSITGINSASEELAGKIGRVFTENGITYKEINEEFEALSEKYESLDKKVKEKVTSYEAAQKAYNDYVAQFPGFNEGAAAYVRGFNAVNEGKGLTVEEIGCIAQLRGDTMYTFMAIRYTDESGAEGRTYATARFSDVPGTETMLQYAESLYASAPATEESDALLSGNILIDKEAVLALI